ncbi:MAG: hypothetical protein KGZ37_07770, partial [Nitrosarchaeum sp.]|nr:hypothetical protein [Nitrosarchaeum sp.]
MIKNNSKIKFSFFIFTIAILIGSIFTVTFRDISEVDIFYIQFNSNNKDLQSNFIQNNLSHHLVFYDTISVSSEKDTLESTVLHQNQYNVVLNLHDEISLQSSSSPDDILLFTEPKNIFAQLDRIFERKITDSITTKKITPLDSLLITNSVDESFEFTSKLAPDIQIFDNQIISQAKIFSDDDTLINNFEFHDHVSNVSWQIPEIHTNYVILLFPLVLTIFLNSEQIKINKQITKKSLSLVFVFILFSASVTTPISISSSYYGMAFAESIDTLPIDTLPIDTLPIDTLPIDTLLVIDTNSTSVIDTNSTSVIDTNSTSVIDTNS